MIGSHLSRERNANTLKPDKRQAFGEAFRVLEPGGRFLYGGIIVANELSESIRRDIESWTGASEA